MPDLTPNLGIKKPLGNENVSRASFNENWDIIDANAAPRSISQLTKLTGDNGYVTVPSATDLNNLLTSGFYYGNNLANAPEGSVYHRITVMMSSSTSGIQEATTNGGKRYIRNMTSGVWGVWMPQSALSSNGQLTSTNQSNVSLSRSTTLSLTSGVDTKIPFTAVNRDVLNEYGSTNSEITVKESGFYLLMGNISLASAYNGNSYIKAYKNGTYLFTIGGGTDQQIIYFSRFAQLVTGDKLTFYVVQNSGATGILNTITAEITKLS